MEVPRTLRVFLSYHSPDHEVARRLADSLAGEVLQDLGDLDGARKAYQWALTIDEKVLGRDHPHARIVHSNLVALVAPSQASISADREGV